MKKSVKQNWLNSLELLFKNPTILLPFIIYAFIDLLALEFIYFSPRKPISFVIGPIIRKFFGEGFLHYPANFVLLPKIFYYTQVLSYVVIGVFLIAAAINIFKNAASNTPVIPKAIIKNAIKLYPSFLAYGILVAIVIFVIMKLDLAFLHRFFKFTSQYAPHKTARLAPILIPAFLFLTNIVIQVFTLLTIPVMIIQKKPLLKALKKSIILGKNSFLGLFILISVPSFIYFPVSLLKGYSYRLINMTFPEITVYITGLGIIIALFVDAFIYVCAAQFLINEEPNEIK